MNRLRMKWAATLVGSSCVLLMTASVGNAGLIPWIWNGLFGPHCPKNNCAPVCAPACGPSYAPSPCGPGGCGVQAYYVPSGCSSCGTSVCGVSGCEFGACGPAGCPSGQCGIPQPSTNERTTEPMPPSTYGDEPGSTTDPSWKGRESNPPTPSEEPSDVEAFRPAAPVPGKDAAPTPSLEDAPTDGATEGEDTSVGPDLNNYLNSKVTWRPTVGHERLMRRPTYASARVIRKPKQAKGEWLVVPSTENIAKR